MSKLGIVHSPLWDSNVPKMNFIYTKDEQEPVQLNTCSTNISGNRCPMTSAKEYSKGNAASLPVLSKKSYCISSGSKIIINVKETKDKLWSYRL